jgi:hypothetical protein
VVASRIFSIVLYYCHTGFDKDFAKSFWQELQFEKVIWNVQDRLEFALSDKA